ncbi:MAG: hypothetical protein ACRDQB_15950, partial [Thermocrispum sp.]
DPDAVPVVGGVWWLVLAAGVLAAAWQALRDRPELRAPVLAVLAFAAEYVLVTSVVTARFLLPVYALAAICVAASAPALTAARARAAVVVVLAAWVGWNATVAVAVNDGEKSKRAQRLALGKELRERTRGQDCVLAAQGNFPEMAFYGGCYGVRFKPGSDVVIPRDHEDATLYVLTTVAPHQLALREPGEVWAVDSGGSRPWWLYRPEGREFVRWR